MELAAGMEVRPSIKLVSPLDTGGMGSVWLAEHTTLKQTVVVKFMLGELDGSSAARARFSREAAAAAAVKSPHVVQMFDHGVMDDGTPFIVMEHLEGRDLGDELAERGALPPALAIGIVSQVAKALTKAHAAGVLHRDIKPPNIFLCKSDHDDELFVKLLDFGIAKSHRPEEATLDGETKTGQVVGTPFYMSPEQVTAQKEIDLRSDLWSLAIVTYEILTGERPYEGPSFGALAVKIATGEPPKPSSVNPSLPPALDAWFAKACAREPEARFASARELADKLRAAFEGVVSLPPLSPSMVDSGPRDPDASLPPASRTPVSIDPEAGSRPSFALASTVDQKSSPPPNPLARSEGGASPVALESKREPSRDDARRGTSRAAIALAVLGIGGALLVGFVIGGGTKDTPTAGSASPRDPSARSTAPPAAPPTASSLAEVAPTSSADPEVVASASASGAPSVSASASASSTAAATVTEIATEDAGPPAKPTATAMATAVPVTTKPFVSVAPRPTVTATPSAKPSASVRPRPPASGEIDVY